jgi:hypothetical protein
MAIKAGTDNKRNVIVAVALFGVLAYLAITQLTGGPTKVNTLPPPATARQAPGTRAAATSAAAGTSATSAPEAHKVSGSSLDPALHLEKLLSSESIEYAGSGRNIFSAESAPVPIEEVKASARPTAPVIMPAVYSPPQPPAIDLHYFGYSATKDGKKQAFLLHGDDIFEAAAGEIVSHRYKIVTVDVRSVQVTDLSYNNTQTQPLVAN